VLPEVGLEVLLDILRVERETALSSLIWEVVSIAQRANFFVRGRWL